MGEVIFKDNEGDRMCKELVLSGTPYERGVTYGAACYHEIRHSIQSYSQLFAERRGISWQQARVLATSFVDVIRSTGEEYLAEMEGIAAGAELDFEDILAINCRSEVLYAPIAPQECTALSLLPPATAEGKVLAAQNWDYVRSQREAVVVLRISDLGGKPDILMFTEAGMIGGKGMNSAGLALMLNALSTTQYAYGLPLHVRMRRILEQTTMEAGYKAAVTGAHPSPANLIITHRDGLSLDLEIECTGVDILQPKKGVIVHTNHFIGPKFSNRPHAASSNTYTRLQRIDALLSDHTGLTVADAKAALCDHAGYPYSICKHTDPHVEKDAMQQGATNYSLIMDLTEGVAHFAWGNPCEIEFTTLAMKI